MVGRGSGRAARISCVEVFGRNWLHPCLHKLQLLLTFYCVRSGFNSDTKHWQAVRSVRRSCSLKIPFLFSAMKQMFVRVSVVLGKRFEHNLAEEGGCMLHCDSLVFAAGASIHPEQPIPSRQFFNSLTWAATVNRSCTFSQCF